MAYLHFFFPLLKQDACSFKKKFDHHMACDFCNKLIITNYPFFFFEKKVLYYSPLRTYTRFGRLQVFKLNSFNESTGIVQDLSSVI